MCVTLKFLYKICVYAGVLKISIKFLSYALSLLSSSLSFFLSPLALPISLLRSRCSCHFALVALGRSEGTVTGDPSFRTNRRRVSIVERSTRDAMSSRDAHVTSTRGVSIISYPYPRRESALSRIIDHVLISLNFFLFNKHALCLAYRVIKVSRKFIPLLLKTLSPSILFPLSRIRSSLFLFVFLLSLYLFLYISHSLTHSFSLSLSSFAR